MEGGKMTGIDRLKAKIKKKMTLDDLPTSQQNNEREDGNTVHTDLQATVCINEQINSPETNTPVLTEVKQYAQQDRNTAIQDNSHGHSNKPFSQNVQQPSNTATNTDSEDYAYETPYPNKYTASTHVQEHTYTASQHSVQQPINSNTVLQHTQTRGVITATQDNVQQHSIADMPGGAQINENTASQYPHGGNVITATQHAVQKDTALNSPNTPQTNSNTALQRNQTGDTRAVLQANAQNYSNAATQQNMQGAGSTVFENNKSRYDRKVTWYLTEELYKAFNDIYARRMIEGRKTEKAALICEAIQLLVREEYK